MADHATNGHRSPPAGWPPHAVPPLIPSTTPNGGGANGSAVALSNDVAAGGGGAEVDAVTAMAVREAKTAFAYMDGAIAARKQGGTENGWSFYGRKESVDILLSVRPDGSMWCLGAGALPTPVARAAATMESDVPEIGETHGQRAFLATGP